AIRLARCLVPPREKPLVTSWRNWTGPLRRSRKPAQTENRIQNDAGQTGSGTLRRRLLVILTIALLPIALVSIAQGVARALSDADAVRERLIQSAQTTASGDQNLFTSAGQI